ncbi:hypothetical protein L228DRAFT_235790 [Xylona heveae TC161]|uniref:Ribosome biogenesis protein SLX9 n=1 Tax=Xylona heveae (strain CBS 132557 / TC161) TaxID=1328760 RepID=A0A165JXZ1_XYLHT|nr:hypothetical protein L228DRAFT_235790 [Xylona heveae TC161]KZF26766.1 hypothetical protein L228DRAFT_235790 [Xylona heveae TC161]
MAPTAGKRSSIRSRAAAKTNAAAASRPVATAFDTGFANTKKDKRTIKHSAFLSKIEKANSNTKKRRRPSKKLVADLDSLVSALPDNDDDEVQDETATARIRHKSLKSRPGAMKRKDKLEKMEMERFARNMAQMVESRPNQPSSNDAASSVQAAPTPSTTSDRWAALRGFISQTMEQKPEFKTA